jgi:transposase
MRRKRCAEFSSKVALTALKDDLTVAELVNKFDVHVNQITEWKKQLLAGALDAFGKNAKRVESNNDAVQALHAKIDKLTMENGFLKSQIGDQ